MNALLEPLKKVFRRRSDGHQALIYHLFAVCLSMVEELANIDALVQCVTSKGAQINDVELKHSPESGCGIYAKTDVARGAALISIPYKLCLTVDLIVSSRHLKSLFEENEGFLAYPDEVLAIGLIYAVLNEQDTDCEWMQHVRTIPRSFNSTIFWSEAELLELKDCLVFQLTNMMRKQIAGDFESLYKPLKASYPEMFGDLTMDLYTWALSVVYSRSIEVTRHEQHVRCIVPVLDMANHNPDAAASPFDTFRYDDATDEISLLCAGGSGPDGELRAGEECCAVYGIYPNSKLIYNYGFVVLNNPHRAIDLWTRLMPSSYQYEAKQRLLQSHELTRVQTYDFKGTIRPAHISPALLATIRVVQANDEQEMSVLGRAFEGRVVSVRNEVATYVSLRNMLLARMKAENAEVSESSIV